MSFHEIFLQAIINKEVLEVTINSKEKGIIVRDCAPLDFWPHARFNDGIDRYMLFHIETGHPSPILPEQIVGFRQTWRYFDPAQVVTWKPPYAWHIARNWGIYS